MKKLVMSLGVFLATYLLLSIEVGQRPIFQHLYGATAPVTKQLQAWAEALVGAGVDGTKTVGSKLFQNTVPEVKAKATKNFKAPEEIISEAEKQKLDNLLKSYSR